MSTRTTETIHQGAAGANNPGGEVELLAAINKGLTGRRWLTPTRVTMDTKFSDIGMDAIDVMCIACELEEAFNVEISDDVIERWTSVSDIASTIREVTGEG